MWCTEKAALTIEGPWWQTVLGNVYDFPLEEMRLVKLPGPAGQNGLAWPAHPAITQIQRSMADALNMAMSGALEPQEAAEVEEILLEY